MRLKEPYQTLKEIIDVENRIVPYIVIAPVVIAIPIIIYNYFNLFRLHTEQATVFCSSAQEKKIGVTSELYTEELELFYNDPLAFERLSSIDKQYFHDAIFDLDSCEVGYLFSGKINGSRKLKFMNKYTDGSQTVYVLDKFVRKK
jgi:hypothetical protein